MAAATTPAALAEAQRRLELRALLQKKYKWIDGKWDLVFWITAIFVVAGAADITKQLFAGDWACWAGGRATHGQPRMTGSSGPTGRIPSGGRGLPLSPRSSLHRRFNTFSGQRGDFQPAPPTP